MKISVIFPTYQRSQDLNIALDSLLEQTLRTYETIIVDQSDDDKTKILCDSEKYVDLHIKYIRSDCKSPPKAKQIGMENVSQGSDIMIFFDDDVKLMPDYLEEVAKFMYANPKALGGWWKILNLPHKKSFLEDVWYILFRNIYVSHEFCTPDAQYKSPHIIQNVLSIIGCNMFYRSYLRECYSFVDWMKRYGHADDTFFSYQISYDHPYSLFYLPSAHIYHYESSAGRIAKIEKFRQILLHRLIFRFQYKFSLLSYLWWSLWFFIWFAMKFNNRLQLAREYIKTLFWWIRYSKELKKDPWFANSWIYK